MGQFDVHASIEIEAPIEAVFEQLTDHESMAGWPGIQSCQLVKQGAPRNGVGAVRRVRAGFISLDEEVIRFDPPQGYAYTIIRGLPVEHRGTVSLTAHQARVTVSWDVHIASRWPLMAQVIGRALARGLPGALAHVKKQIEGRAPRQ